MKFIRDPNSKPMIRFRVLGAICVCSLFFASMNERRLAAQDYPNSVASTDFDYIHSDDPSCFEQLEYVGKLGSEMPDKRYDNRPLIHPAFVFVATFSDGTSVQLSIDAAFESEDAAKSEAERYVPRLGKLPTALRLGVDRLVVHKGGKDTTAFSDVGLIVVYSENATKRISTHDLEETIFHESVHAAWDKEHANSDAWKRAQTQDGGFVTVYAKERPGREDLAESALFAYTLLHHPGRIPKVDAKKIKQAIPARIIYVGELVPPGEPIFYPVAKEKVVPQDLESDSGTGDQGGTSQQSSERSMNGDEDTKCQVDLASAGQLSDILSNALVLGFRKEEQPVRQFLADARRKEASAERLFQLALIEFGLNESDLKVKLAEYLHCNCDHVSDPDSIERARKLMETWAPRSSKKDK